MSTTAQFPNDGDTVDIWHLDGTTSSAGKLDGVNGNDLTEGATAPVAITGQIVPTSNGAADFDNTANQYYTLGDLASMPTGSFTWEFWVNFQGTPGDSEGLITKYGTAGTRTFFIQRDPNNKITFSVSSDGSNFTNLTSTTALSTSSWYYVACVFTASTRMEIFFNGSSDASTTTSIPASAFNGTSALDFGAYAAFRSTGANVYDGLLDEIRLSDIARTSTEIFDYYNPTTSDIKTLDTIAQANIKTFNGITNANTKTWNGVSNV